MSESKTKPAARSGMSCLVAAMLLVLASAAAAPAAEPFDRLADPETAPYSIAAAGFVMDSGHPMHPGDSRRYDVTLRVGVDPLAGESVLELSVSEGEDTELDRYFVRRGRLFQVNDAGEEIATSAFADLAGPTLAALHPAVVANAMRERRENVRPAGDGRWLFAWNDELWTVEIDPADGLIGSLSRDTADDLLGDGTETVRYVHAAEGGPVAVASASVDARGKEIARLDFGAPVRGVPVTVPDGNRRRDRTLVVRPGEITPTEVAPHLFTIDLASANTRVTVAEFTDHLVVLEGAYTSRNCDAIARVLRESFDKPVRYFACSHLHGQYLGGVRSWVAVGATVLVPPSTAPLVEEIVASRHSLRPDALEAAPRPLSVEPVPLRRVLEDDMNALEILNVESGHTDEYLLFWFPRQRVLLTGDLLFYKPAKALTGRSQKLCRTLEKLGIEPDACLATWPLFGYETRNVVTGEELRAACAASP